MVQLRIAGVVAALSFFAAAEVPAADVLPLGGTWQLALDPGDRGLGESWERRPLEAGAPITLPGVLQAQGFGDQVTVDTPWTGQIMDRSFFTAPRYAPYREPGRVKLPFWLQPERHYTGAAWYEREVEVPESWRGRRVVLHLERPHWQTIAWVDGRAIGSDDSLSTPHEHDLGTGLAPGRHRITVRVDNRLVVDIGTNSHSISDHTQGNWNGIAGAIELRATSPVFVDELQAYPDLAGRTLRLRGSIGNATGAPGRGRLVVMLGGENTFADAAWGKDGGPFDLRVPLPKDAAAWDEFAPRLVELRARLESDRGFDERALRVGLREVATSGTQITLNGRKLFLRGTLECAIFPKTGHPPTDLEEWKRIVGIAKAHGLNSIRFHSWCPPRAAFEAADALGFYFQVEAGSWANGSTRLGIGLPVDDWVERETRRILRAYGNHASFLLMAYGNEPAGRDREYLARWVTRRRGEDPRRLYTSAAGWPQIEENQFHVSPDPRIQAWGEGLKSRVNAKPPQTTADYRDYVRARPVPVVSHEIGQWCAFPNLAERAKYTGYLKAKNFDIFADTLASRGMADQAADFLHASGKLQTLLYKEDIESALRTPGMGGFQLLDLHDFPGQGTALVGVLDAFWDSKGYVTPEAFRRFSGETVPLARLAKRVFTTAETLEAELEVAHFGPAPLAKARPRWRLVDEAGRVAREGRLAARGVPVDNATALGRAQVALAGLRAPARYRLELALEGTPFANDWDVWVYPPRVETAAPKNLAVVREVDDALARLAAGETVVWLVPPARVRGDEQGKVELGFSSIFWNTAWTSRQAPHTLGVLCDPRHPALAAFPTESHSNWQWWYVVSRAGAMILDGLPRELRPTVQVIDDWFTSRRLGLVFEARHGRGRLLAASVDLDGQLADPVSRQLRHSLLRYAAGPGFRPAVEVSADQLRALVQP